MSNSTNQQISHKSITTPTETWDVVAYIRTNFGNYYAKSVDAVNKRFVTFYGMNGTFVTDGKSAVEATKVDMGGDFAVEWQKDEEKDVPF